MEEQRSKLGKLWNLTKEYKYWWLIPLLLAGAIIGLLLFSTDVSSPVIYRNF